MSTIEDHNREQAGITAMHEHDQDKETVTLNPRELAAVLAGLRCWQGHLESGADPYAVEEIHEDGGRIKPLSVEEIDELCERINR